ncbi:MAG TPA: amidohydrolase family protein [Anaerolineales bacterium]|nr:amidohydrolase family protein [Anaerolineales bacterium]
MIDLILRNATLQGGYDNIDFAIDAGVLIASGQKLNYPTRQEIDLKGRLLFPGFIDPHVHLDIALMNPWSQPGRQEEFHLLSDLNDAIELRRKSFSQQDIEQRAGAALELASRHGITHLRAQCHLDTEIGLSHIKALQHVKEAYAGRVTIQIVAFPQQGFWRNPGTLDLYREAFRIGADVMGCASNLDYDESGYVDFKKHIDTAFDLAMELDVDLDIHADLGIPQSITLEELEIVHIARKTIETGYQGRVTAGHVCALDSALPEVAQQVIQLILEAGISVVSQPDLYRLGREDTHNTRRGLTRVKELLTAGVNVTFASNNVRDALRPMGNLDPLEEALILSYGAHMDTIEEFNTLLKMCTYHGAKALGVQNYGLEPGCNADLVVLDACSPSAAIVGQVEKNYVFKAGQLMASSWVKSEIFNGTQLQEVQNY